MKKILVLTDFSYSSFNAARYAVMLAGTFNSCRIILYNSFVYIPITSEGALPGAMDVTAFEEESMSRLRDVEISLAPFQKFGTSIECRTDQRPLVKAAEEMVRNESVDLTVAGSKGRSVPGDLFFGSNTVNLINHFHMPLLIIPPKAIYEPVMSAVFACELNQVEKIPVNTIRTFIRELQCKLFILNIDKHSEDQLNTDQILQMSKLHELMDDTHPEYHYTNNRNIDEGISQFCEKHQAGVLILIHKKYGFLHKLLHSSITRKMATHAAIPLLVLKETSEYQGSEPEVETQQEARNA
ncbi:MAG TPA: universal stress protein [Sphingobacteriaceae bacterium]